MDEQMKLKSGHIEEEKFARLSHNGFSPAIATIDREIDDMNNVTGTEDRENWKMRQTL
jgi:hypothetical protein